MKTFNTRRHYWVNTSPKIRTKVTDIIIATNGLNILSKYSGRACNIDGTWAQPFNEIQNAEYIEVQTNSIQFQFHVLVFHNSNWLLFSLCLIVYFLNYLLLSISKVICFTDSQMKNWYSLAKKSYLHCNSIT